MLFSVLESWYPIWRHLPVRWACAEGRCLKERASLVYLPARGANSHRKASSQRAPIPSMRILPSWSIALPWSLLSNTITLANRNFQDMFTLCYTINLKNIFLFSAKTLYPLTIHHPYHQRSMVTTILCCCGLDFFNPTNEILYSMYLSLPGFVSEPPLCPCCQEWQYFLKKKKKAD